MTSLQGPARQNSPEPFADLVSRLQAMQREMSDMTSSLLRSAGIRVSHEGMSIESALEILGSLDVSGSLGVTGPMVVGGTLDVTGDAVFSGDLAVPNGSISNAALASPVTAGIGSGSGSGFGVATSPAVVASGSIPVPAGYSQALVIATSGITAVSATASATQVYAATEIGGAGGAELWVLTDGAAYTATVTTAHARTMTGLSGGSISIGARVRSTIAWGAHPANSAVVSASALFFR